MRDTIESWGYVVECGRVPWCVNPDLDSKYKIIIEVDGDRHFKCFSTPGRGTNSSMIAIQADVFKMARAQANGVSVIRICQEDAWNDRWAEWNVALRAALQSLDKPQVSFLSCDPHLYDRHREAWANAQTLLVTFPTRAEREAAHALLDDDDDDDDATNEKEEEDEDECASTISGTKRKRNESLLCVQSTMLQELLNFECNKRQRKQTKMHVLLSTGNCPGLGTGYGNQSKLLLRAILSSGNGNNTCTVWAWNYRLFQGHGQNPQSLKPMKTADFIRIAPGMQHVFDELDSAEKKQWTRRVTWMGNPYHTFPVPIERAVVNSAILNCNADMFITLQDIFMFQPGPFACTSVAYIPLHFLPIEKATARVLSDFDGIVALSGYGENLLHTLFNSSLSPSSSLKHIEMIPHGRESSVFKPLPHALGSSDIDIARTRSAKIKLRSELGWPTVSHSAQTTTAALSADEWERAPGGDGSVFIVLLIASNSEESGRKALDAQIQAFIEFARQREMQGFPRDATFLVLHAEAVRAYDLGILLQTFGEFPERPEQLEDRRGRTKTDFTRELRGQRFLISASQALGTTSDARIATMMAAADAMLVASASEGFGVPIIEVQQCGTPVVTNAVTSMPEQTILGLSAAPGQYIARSDFGSGWFLPSVPNVARALLAISQWSDAERARRAAIAVPLVNRKYDSAVVQAQWAHFLGRWERDVVKAPSIPQALSLQLQLSTLAPPRSSVKFRAWLDAGAQNFLITLSKERALYLQATRAAFGKSRQLQAERQKEKHVRVMRQHLAARLMYVRSAIQAYRAVRQSLMNTKPKTQ